MTGGELPDELGPDGVANRSRRRQRRRRVGGALASVVVVGAAAIGVSRLDGGADAVTTAEVTLEASESTRETPPETTMGPTDSESSEFGLTVAERSDGPFEWSRLAGADPTLDVIIGLQVGRSTGALPSLLASQATLDAAEHLADVRLTLVEVDGSPDVPDLEVTVVAQRLADGSVRYLLFELIDTGPDTNRQGPVCGGPLRSTGVAYVVETTLPAEVACAEAALFASLFQDEFGLSVSVDERVTLSGADGIEAVFELRSKYPKLDPGSGGGETGLLISDSGARFFDPLSGETETVLNEIDEWLQVALSPDASTIAWVEESGVYVSDLPSGEAILWFEPQGLVAFPVWSPDSKTLAFTLIPGEGNFSVWTVEANSAEPVQVSEPLLVDDNGVSFSLNAFPSWSPDGSQLVFQDLSEPSSIVIADRNGNLESLAVGSSAYFPSWSPDGDTIVFAGSDGSNSGDLWTVSPDGSALARITNVGLDGVESLSPAWSPDGRHVAFLASVDGSAALYVIGSEGQVPTLLAYGSDLGQSFKPVWSPDATQIAVQGAGGEVLIIEVDTGARRFTGEIGRVNDWR